MNKSMPFFVFLIVCFVNSQAQNSITKIDFVKIKNGKRIEAIYFYENNWKVYRDIALEKGYIKSYKLLSTASDSTANFDLMLITEYIDSLQEKLSEERFQQIIKTSSPNGPRLLNNLKPNEFRLNLFLKEASTIFSGKENTQLSNLSAFSLKWEHYKFANGINVLLQHDSTQKEVAVEFWVRSGSRDETPGKYGLAHFFEHCTPFTSDTALLKHVRAIRINSNAQTRKDYLRYYVQVKPDGVEAVIKSLADRLKANSDTFSTAVIEHERGRVLSEINRQEMNPLYGSLSTSAREAATFGTGHPYGHSTYGTVKENEQFTLADIKNWYQQYIFANNIIVFVTGNFDKEKTKATIDGSFSSIQSKAATSPRKTMDPLTKLASVSISAPIPNHYLSITWPVPGYGTQDYPAVNILSEVLEQRLASPTFQSVVKSGARSLFNVYELAGQFGVYASFTRLSDSSIIENYLQKTIEQILQNEISENELVNAKRTIEKNVEEKMGRLGFNESRTELIGEGLLFKNNPDFYMLILKQQSLLTTGEIKKAAEQWLKKMGARVLLISNK